MAGRNTGKTGNFATIQEIRNAKKQAEAAKKSRAELSKATKNKKKKR